MRRFGLIFRFGLMFHTVLTCQVRHRSASHHLPHLTDPSKTALRSASARLAFSAARAAARSRSCARRFGPMSMRLSAKRGTQQAGNSQPWATVRGPQTVQAYARPRRSLEHARSIELPRRSTRGPCGRTPSPAGCHTAQRPPRREDRCHAGRAACARRKMINWHRGTSTHVAHRLFRPSADPSVNPCGADRTPGSQCKKSPPLMPLATARLAGPAVPLANSSAPTLGSRGATLR